MADERTTGAGCGCWGEYAGPGRLRTLESVCSYHQPLAHLWAVVSRLAERMRGTRDHHCSGPECVNCGYSGLLAQVELALDELRVNL